MERSQHRDLRERGPLFKLAYGGSRFVIRGQELGLSISDEPLLHNDCVVAQQVEYRGRRDVEVGADASRDLARLVSVDCLGNLLWAQSPQFREYRTKRVQLHPPPGGLELRVFCSSRRGEGQLQRV